MGVPGRKRDQARLRFVAGGRRKCRVHLLPPARGSTFRCLHHRQSTDLARSTVSVHGLHARRQHLSWVSLFAEGQPCTEASECRREAMAQPPLHRLGLDDVLAKVMRDESVHHEDRERQGHEDST